MLGKEDGFNSNIDLSGLKIAYVVSNEDPKCQERVLVRVLGIHNLENMSTDNGVWAYHCAPYRSTSGDLPEPGDYIYVLFPNRTDPMNIVWLGYVRSSYQGGVDGTDDSIKSTHKEVKTTGFSDKILNFINKIF